MGNGKILSAIEANILEFVIENVNFNMCLTEKGKNWDYLIAKIHSILSVLDLKKRVPEEYEYIMSMLYSAFFSIYKFNIESIAAKVNSESEKISLEKHKNDVEGIRFRLDEFRYSFKPNVVNATTEAEVESILHTLLKNLNTKIASFTTPSSYRINDKALKALNLGFFILNSGTMQAIPAGEIVNDKFDYKEMFFPDWEPIKGNDYVTALKMFDISINYDNNNVYARVFKELALVQRENNGYSSYDLSASVKKLTQVVSDFPNNPISHITLAFVLAITGKANDAIIHLDIALKLGPQSSYVHFQASKIYQIAGNDQKVKYTLFRAKELSLLNKRVHFDLALIATEENDLASAWLYIDKAADSSPVKKHYWIRKQIYSEVFRSIPKHLYKEIVMKQTLLDDISILTKLDKREAFYKKTNDLIDFEVVLIASDFKSFSVLDLSSSEFKTYGLKNGKKSIYFCDYNCNYEMISNSEIFIVPQRLIKGRYAASSKGFVRLSGLDISQLLN